MNKMIICRIIYWLLQFSWAVIQNICGLFLFIFLNLKDSKRYKTMYRGAIVTDWNNTASMGLGMFIFCGHRKSSICDEVMVHEYGHTIQSVILGPLFIPVIGIPSMLWGNLKYFVKMRKEKHISYMRFYPESWANHLGEKITGEKAVKN